MLAPFRSPRCGQSFSRRSLSRGRMRRTATSVGTTGCSVACTAGCAGPGCWTSWASAWRSVRGVLAAGKRAVGICGRPPGCGGSLTSSFWRGGGGGGVRGGAGATAARAASWRMEVRHRACKRRGWRQNGHALGEDHWKHELVTMATASLLVAPEVDVMTIAGAANDDEVGIMVTRGFQYKNALVMKNGRFH